MDDRDGERVDALGVENLTDSVLETWRAAGLGSDGRWQWPDDEARYRLDLPARDDPTGLDVVAAVLDATPRTPETVAVHVERGRRDDLLGDRRDALVRLGANADVTALDHDTAGAAPATADTLDAVFRLYGEGLLRAAVLDGSGEAIVEYLDGRVAVSLPTGREAAVRSALGKGGDGRLERRG